jgi:hypothetical protein
MFVFVETGRVKAVVLIVLVPGSQSERGMPESHM